MSSRTFDAYFSGHRVIGVRAWSESGHAWYSRITLWK